MMKEQDKINFGKYHKTLLHIHTPGSYDFKLYDEWNKQYFYAISEDEIFRIAKKENFLYSEYSNINDLKELDIFKNYKNLKEMLSYFDIQHIH